MTPATDHGLPWKTSFAGICMSSGTSTVSVTAAGFQDSFSRGHSAGGTTWADLGGLQLIEVILVGISAPYARAL